MQMPMPTGSTPKSICPPPHRWGDIKNQIFSFFFLSVKMAVNNTKFKRVGRLEADFQQIPLFKHINIYKSAKKSIKILDKN